MAVTSDQETILGALPAIGIDPNKLLLRLGPGKKEFSNCQCWVEGWVEKEGDKPQDKFVSLTELFTKKIDKLKFSNAFLNAAFINMVIYDFSIMMKNYSAPSDEILDQVMISSTLKESGVQRKSREELLQDSKLALESLREEFEKKHKFEKMVDVPKKDGSFDRQEVITYKTKKDIVFEQIIKLSESGKQKFNSKAEISQYILQDILDRNITDELVKAMVSFAELPDTFQQAFKNKNISQKVLKTLSNRDDLSLTQLSNVLNAAKVLDGKIGKEGVNLILNQVQKFSGKVVSAMSDNNHDEMIKLNHDLVTALKKNENGERGLLKHLSKSIRSRMQKFFAKLGRIITLREAEYQERKTRRNAAVRSLETLGGMLEKHLREKSKTAVPAEVEVNVEGTPTLEPGAQAGSSGVLSMNDIFKVLDDFIKELDKVLMAEKASEQTEKSNLALDPRGSLPGSEKSELDRLIEELEAEFKTDLETEFLPFSLEAPSYEHTWVEPTEDSSSKLGRKLEVAMEEFEEQNQKKQKLQDAQADVKGQKYLITKQKNKTSDEVPPKPQLKP